NGASPTKTRQRKTESDSLSGIIAGLRGRASLSKGTRHNLGVPRIGDGMMASASMPRLHLVELTGGDPFAEFARDVAAGLTAEPKQLSCRYFYDREGSHLFAAICELPEYYLTRAETEILECHAREIASLFPDDVTVIELGSGNAVKT